jgi:alkylation response protein AidB-like acyl-CoA dehydrogenase
MDVRLSAEQRALREAAAQLVGDHAPASVAELDDTARRARLEAALTGSGWRELRVPDDDGGPPPASCVETAIVAEELGRGPADTSFLGPTLATELRRRAGAGPATAHETVLLRSDLSGLVVVEDADTLCTGVAIDARDATSALALIRVGHGYDLVAVPVAGALRGRDLTRPAGTVDRAPFERLRDAGRRPLTSEDIEAWSAFALALTCADLVGTMRGAVDLACAYAGVRRQYGVAIGTFQSVHHMLADAFVSIEGSSSVARHAAWAADTLPAGEALAAAATAKAYCARAAREVCETSVQVHGGIGMTWECLAHIHLRRALLSTQVLGDVGANLARIVAHRKIGGVPDGLR